MAHRAKELLRPLATEHWGTILAATVSFCRGAFKGVAAARGGTKNKRHVPGQTSMPVPVQVYAAMGHAALFAICQLTLPVGTGLYLLVFVLTGLASFVAKRGASVPYLLTPKRRFVSRL